MSYAHTPFALMIPTNGGAGVAPRRVGGSSLHHFLQLQPSPTCSFGRACFPLNTHYLLALSWFWCKTYQRYVHRRGFSNPLGSNPHLWSEGGRREVGGKLSIVGCSSFRLDLCSCYFVCYFGRNAAAFGFVVVFVGLGGALHFLGNTYKGG